MTLAEVVMYGIICYVGGIFVGYFIWGHKPKLKKGAKK